MLSMNLRYFGTSLSFGFGGSRLTTLRNNKKYKKREAHLGDISIPKWISIGQGCLVKLPSLSIIYALGWLRLTLSSATTNLRVYIGDFYWASFDA